MKKYIKNLILFINNFLIFHNLMKKEYSIIKKYYKFNFFGRIGSSKLSNQKKILILIKLLINLLRTLLKMYKNKVFKFFINEHQFKIGFFQI